MPSRSARSPRSTASASRHERKHEVAKALLRTLWAERAGILSTQVLQEFYVNVTRKIRKPLTKPEARIGLRDALILAVAARSGARRVVSEDLNAGQAIAGVTIQNPFKEPPPTKQRRA